VEYRMRRGSSSELEKMAADELTGTREGGGGGGRGRVWQPRVLGPRWQR